MSNKDQAIQAARDAADVAAQAAFDYPPKSPEVQGAIAAMSTAIRDAKAAGATLAEINAD